MSDKNDVTFRIEGRFVIEAKVAMTREEYDRHCEWVDNAIGGVEREAAAERLMSLAGIDMRDGDVDDLQVEEIYSPVFHKATA